jgi:VWFA-related protein
VLFSLPIRRLIWLTSGFVLALTPPTAGQNPPSAEATFSARTELVTVPVIVTDKSGSHLQNLKKEDFIILEDGKEQKIASFEEIVKPSSPVQPVTKQPNQFSNVLVQGAVPMRLTILVLDLINTPFEDRIYAEQQILK